MITSILAVIEDILIPFRYSNCKPRRDFSGIGEIEGIGFMDTSWLLMIKIDSKNHRLEVLLVNGIEYAVFLNTTQTFPFGSIEIR